MNVLFKKQILAYELAEALASTILHMDSIGQSKRKIIGQRGKQFVLRHYSYVTLAKKFMEAFK
tara:strand:- start:30 stop:218 length:189 start_codon:yes stop_codon:yes gene_type:complete